MIEVGRRKKVRDQGKGLTRYTLVLLPGLDGTGTLFSRLVSEVSPNLDIQIIAYPPRAFLSYAELVARLPEIVPKDRELIIVAESFSTPLAVKFAATHPQMLAGMVLCAGFVTPPVICPRLLRILARPLVFRLSWLGVMMEYFLLGADAPQDIRDAVRQAIRQVDPLVLARRLQAVLGCDARNDLTHVDVPILYMQAEEDHLVPSSCFEEIRSLRPSVTLASVAAPHLILQRQPGQAAEAIVRFRDRLDGEDRTGSAEGRELHQRWPD
jgi:pimeloyl-[acyl-carrier protein] methyl ester esterase